jgi:hypothetical protein
MVSWKLLSPGVSLGNRVTDSLAELGPDRPPQLLIIPRMVLARWLVMRCDRGAALVQLSPPGWMTGFLTPEIS